MYLLIIYNLVKKQPNQQKGYIYSKKQPYYFSFPQSYPQFLCVTRLLYMNLVTYNL